MAGSMWPWKHSPHSAVCESSEPDPQVQSFRAWVRTWVRSAILGEVSCGCPCILNVDPQPCGFSAMAVHVSLAAPQAHATNHHKGRQV